MAYSDQRLVGEASPEDITLQRAIAFMVAQPDRVLSPEECGQFAGAIARACAHFGVKFSPRFVQAMVETNNGRYGGQVRVEQKNIGGIGATDDGAAGISNPTWEVAGHVFVAHSLAWAGDPRGIDSPRWSLVREKAKRTGYATTFRELGGGRWATDLYYGDAIDKRREAIARLPMATKLARVPRPPIVNRLIVQQTKINGVGMTATTTPRVPKFTVDHSMVGTLLGTDSWFAKPSVQGLTDFGIGSREKELGFAEIRMWCDPFGKVIPWASGPVGRHFGDGTRVVNTYGADGVNRHGVSIEHDDGGNPNNPMTGPCWASSAWLHAYIHDNWLDQTADTFDWNVHHREICGTDYKDCPFARIYDHTSDFQNTIRAIMRHFNEGIGYADHDKVIAGIPIAVPLNTGKPDTNPAPVYPENYDPITGHYIGVEVFDFYRLLGGMAIVGRPLAGMVLYSDGWLRQPFERLTLGHRMGLTQVESVGAALAMQTGSPYPVWGDIVPLL
jgi:hypothetical protein